MKTPLSEARFKSALLPGQLLVRLATTRDHFFSLNAFHVVFTHPTFPQVREDMPVPSIGGFTVETPQLDERLMEGVRSAVEHTRASLDSLSFLLCDDRITPADLRAAAARLDRAAARSPLGACI